MLELNTQVRYGDRGIFCVKEITRKKNKERKWEDWYVLCAMHEGVETTVVTPSWNQKIRPLLRQEEILQIMEDMEHLPTIWIEDKRLRTDTFKEILSSGDFLKMAQLIKTIYLKKQEKSAVHKMISDQDNEILKYAEGLLFEEIALCFNVECEQVAQFIMQKVQQLENN